MHLKSIYFIIKHRNITLVWWRTSVLRDQQYMFAVWSVLMVNNLAVADLSFWWAMQQLQQPNLWHGLTGENSEMNFDNMLKMKHQCLMWFA